MSLNCNLRNTLLIKVERHHTLACVTHTFTTRTHTHKIRYSYVAAVNYIAWALAEFGGMPSLVLVCACNDRANKVPDVITFRRGTDGIPAHCLLSPFPLLPSVPPPPPMQSVRKKSANGTTDQISATRECGRREERVTVLPYKRCAENFLHIDRSDVFRSRLCSGDLKFWNARSKDSFKREKKNSLSLICIF